MHFSRLVFCGGTRKGYLTLAETGKISEISYMKFITFFKISINFNFTSANPERFIIE